MYAYLRLAQREAGPLPALGDRLRLGRRALSYSSFNLAVAGVLATVAVLPPLLPAPYVLQWLETVYGTLLRPATGMRPTAIGVRQLIVSSLFTLLFILAIRL